MKPVVMCLLLGAWALAIAQAPPGEEQTEGPESPAQDAPCVPADDLPQASDGEPGPLEREPGDSAQGSVPCDELLSAEEAGDAIAGPETIEEEAGDAIAGPEMVEEQAGEAVAGPEAMEEEDLGTEASVEEVFEPGDEISEDYPVPLPSDI